MSQQVDYRAIFKRLPGVTVVLSPDFTVLDVSDDTLDEAARPAKDITGKNLFELFRHNPQDPDAEGPRDLRASLEEVLASGERDVMRLTRYDMEDPSKPGVFDERYWAIVNIPVVTDGHVDMIIFRAMEVTHLVNAALMINS